jgi:hypothetical protein
MRTPFTICTTPSRAAGSANTMGISAAEHAAMTTTEGAAKVKAVMDSMTPFPAAPRAKATSRPPDDPRRRHPTPRTDRLRSSTARGPLFTDFWIRQCATGARLTGTSVLTCASRRMSPATGTDGPSCRHRPDRKLRHGRRDPPMPVLRPAVRLPQRDPRPRHARPSRSRRRRGRDRAPRAPPPVTAAGDVDNRYDRPRTNQTRVAPPVVAPDASMGTYDHCAGAW